MDRHFYLLLLGLVAGLLLGPGVLGRHWPDTYQRWFKGGAEAQQELDDFDNDAQQSRQRLAQSGVTPAALVEFDLRIQQQRQPYITQLQTRQTQHRQWLWSNMTTLVLAAVVLLLIKTLITTKRVHLRGGCNTACYALLSIWLAMLIAQPAVLKSLPLMFLILLIGVSLIAAFMPLGAPGRSV